MKNGENKPPDFEDLCANIGSKNLWIIGVVVIVLASIFIFAIFRTKGDNSNAPVRQAFPAQQAAFQQSNYPIQCPFCGFAYNDLYAAARGGSRCPNCQGVVPAANRANNGLTNVALPANCMACPTVTQCFPPGQTVAFTQPVKAPPIFRDALMPHRFRGVCENCHIVKPDIAISSGAIPPHEYRGVCSNCHTILR